MVQAGWRDNWRDLPASTLDIPIQREPVGAMRITSGSGCQPDNFHDGFRPYVYRGTGVDTLTPDLVDYPAKPKPRKRKAKKSKPRQEWRPRLGDRRHPEHHLYYALAPEDEEPDPFEFLETESVTPARPARPARPSPGWQPTSGLDIDALLAELEERDGPLDHST